MVNARIPYEQGLKELKILIFGGGSECDLAHRTFASNGGIGMA
jgi:hypothetical protein